MRVIAVLKQKVSTLVHDVRLHLRKVSCLYFEHYFRKMCFLSTTKNTYTLNIIEFEEIKIHFKTDPSFL